MPSSILGELIYVAPSNGLQLVEFGTTTNRAFVNAMALVAKGASMRIQLGSFACRALSFIYLLFAASAFAGDTPFDVRTVIMEGESSSGTGAGSVFGGFGGVAIDDQGRAGFKGFLSGPGINSENNEGLWVEEGGALSLLVRKSGEVPGAPSGTTFQNIDGFPSLGKFGLSGFRARLQRPDGSNSSIWKRSGGVTSPIAKSGDTVSGVEPNTRISSIYSPVCNGNNSLVFYADIYNDPSVLVPSVWQSDDTGLSMIARRGEPAPGAATGITFEDFVISSISGNSSGQSLFMATLAGPGIFNEDEHGLWLNDNNALSLVARTGMAAPGLPTGSTFGTILAERFLLNENGRTAFVSHTNLSGSPFNAFTVYVGNASSLRLVAKEDDQAPGLPSGVRLDQIQFMDPHLPISRNDKTAFSAYLAGPGVNNSNRKALFSEGFGDLALVAREGEQAPGTEAGVLFESFHRLELSGSGQAIFGAELRGTGVTSSNQFGLWVQTPGGDLQLVVRTGTPFEIEPGQSRIVSHFSFLGNSAGSLFDGSRAQSFNDRGDIGLGIGFSDGSSGVFVVSTPEPSNLFLLLVGGTLFRRRMLTH